MVRFVAKSGYQGLEIAPFTIADTVTEISQSKRQELKSIAMDAGIELVGLHWLLVKPEGLHINHPDPICRQQTVDYLKHLIDFCADLGGNRMVFGSPNQRKILPELTYERGRQLAIESFIACSEVAMERGVVICLEALPDNQTNFMTNNEEVLSVVKEINHPNIRMMLDVKSMCSEAISIPQNILNCQGFFHHIHANDSNLKGPGFGQVDFRPILDTLQKLDYQEYVSVEVFDFTPDPETITIECLRYMKDCLK